MELKEQYYAAKYRIQGNGPRTINILKEAFSNIDETIPSDFYGSGKIINDFEDKFANILGKESAIFFPSGTMAQQIALRINSDKKKCNKVAFHPLSHLEIHEKDAIRTVQNLEPILLGTKARLLTVEDLISNKEEISSLLLELPQRELGGMLPSIEELKAISNYTKENGINLHLDGARLFETLPYYNKSASEIASLFDSVYISFYKGIGGIAGAILAGNNDFIEEAKIWKRRLGGDLICLYPYIIPANYYFEKRKNKFNEYYQNSKTLAQLVNNLPYAYTVPLIPVTNMFHVYINKSKAELLKIVTQIFKEFNVSITNHIVSKKDNLMKFEISIGDDFSLIPNELLTQLFDKLNYLN